MQKLEGANKVYYGQLESGEWSMLALLRNRKKNWLTCTYPRLRVHVTDFHWDIKESKSKQQEFSSRKGHANMENPLQILQDISFSTWVAVILGILAFLYWQGVRSYYSILGSSPLPGPRPWPWVGNLPDFLRYGGMHKMLLNYFYKYGRVHTICIGRQPAIVVTDPEMIKQITVKEFWKFPNRPPFVRPSPPLDSALFIARDDKWRRVRNTLTPTFTASKLKQIVPIIEEASNILVTKMQKCSETGKDK